MRYAIAFAVITLIWLPSCQTTTDSSTNTVSDLGSLPKATSPVSGSSSALMSNLFTASSGVKLKDAHSTTWSSSKSRPMCEVSRIVRDTYFHAATPDMMLCIISSLSNNGKFGSSIYDGSYKHFNFTVPNFADVRIKFNVAKSGDSITTFNLFLCQGSGGTYTQTGYVGEDLTNNSNVSMTSVFKATVDSNTFGARSSIAGAVNKQGAWTSKSLTSTTSSTISSKTFSSKSTVTQHNDRLELDSFMTGNCSNDTFTNRLYSIAQIITPDSLTNFALGDGSARYVLSFARTGSDSQSFDSTKSWTGDNQAAVANPSSNGAYYSSVSGKTPRSTESVSIDFSTDETWGCAAGEGQFSPIVFADISQKLVTDVAACLTTYAGSTRDYIDCYSATGE